jgi:hypothetical protein
MYIRTYTAAIAFAAFGLPYPTYAGTVALPDAVFVGQLAARTPELVYTDVTGEGFFTASGSGQAGRASSDAYLATSGGPVIDAKSQASTDGCAPFAGASKSCSYTNGDAQLRYSLEIVGPGESGTTIPVFVQAYGSATASFGSARVAFWFDGNSYFQAETFGGFDSFSVASTFQMLVNTQYTVILDADTQAVSGFQDGVPIQGFGHAFVDPVFTIDPSVAGLYSLQLSPGVANALPSAVPEPSTWAMMLVGVVGLGFAGYRRNKAATLAA